MHHHALTAALAFTLAAAAAPDARAEAGWDGGFFFAGADDDGHSYRLEIGGRLQTRATVTAPEAGGDTEAAFSMRRVRLSFGGHLMTEDLTWKTQVDLGRGQTALLDGFVEVRLSPGVRLRVGQGKRPMSRQQITSSGRQALADRAITDDAFGAGRDVGLMLHSGFGREGEVFEWALGVFNGTGIAPVDGTNVPDRFQPQIAARVGVGTRGFRDRYVEGDRVAGPWRVTAGASALVNPGARDEGDGDVRAQVDVSLKGAGLSVDGAGYVSSAFGDGPVGDAWGVHAQLSYFIAGPRLLPTARYARVVPDGRPARQEIRGGITWLIVGDLLELTVDAGHVTLEVDGAARDATVARVQLQLDL